MSFSRNPCCSIRNSIASTGSGCGELKTDLFVMFDELRKQFQLCSVVRIGIGIVRRESCNLIELAPVLLFGVDDPRFHGRPLLGGVACARRTRRGCLSSRPRRCQFDSRQLLRNGSIVKVPIYLSTTRRIIERPCLPHRPSTPASPRHRPSCRGLRPSSRRPSRTCRAICRGSAA